MEKGKRKEQGITLIALVITIIVLLILAGVSIAMLTGQNGILTQANNAKIEQSHGAVKDSIALLYNEYQIQINTASNTKFASTEKVTIKGKEEKAQANTSMTFLEFLKGGNSQGITYIKEGTDNVLDVEKLTGGKQSLGNGTDTDVYKIEDQDGSYVVNYYDQNGTPQEIWNVSKTESSTEDTSAIKMLIVTDENGYAVLPIETTEKCIIDWGDGNVTNGTETETIAKLPKLASVGKIKIGVMAWPKGYEHKYEKSNSEYVVTISGKVEELEPTSRSSDDAMGGAELYLKEIIQWGETGLRSINFGDFHNLTKIAQPTEKSFEELEGVNFSYSAITSIPDRMFENCTKIKSFGGAFVDCSNLTTIGDYAFAGCSSATDFDYMFYNSNVSTFSIAPPQQDFSKLTTIGDYAFAGCSSATSFVRTFSNCTGLTTIGDYAFSRCSSVTSFAFCFADCINLASIGEGVFDGCDKVKAFYNCFENCTSLTTVREDIFDGCDNVTNFNSTFAGCTNLTGKAPGLWLRVVDGEAPSGYGCFYGCDKLSNSGDIPDEWKQEEDW